MFGGVGGDKCSGAQSGIKEKKYVSSQEVAGMTSGTLTIKIQDGEKIKNKSFGHARTWQKNKKKLRTAHAQNKQINGASYVSARNKQNGTACSLYHPQKKRDHWPTKIAMTFLLKTAMIFLLKTAMTFSWKALTIFLPKATTISLRKTTKLSSENCHDFLLERRNNFPSESHHDFSRKTTISLRKTATISHRKTSTVPLPKTARLSENG